MLRPTSTTSRFLVLTALVCCALGGATLSAFRARTLKAILFAPATAAAAPAQETAVEVVRARYVTVDVGALLATRSSEANEATRPTLLLNLFDDVAYNAVLDRMDPAEGGFTWVGHIQGVDGSAATLAQVDGVMAGTIVIADAIYTVRYLGAGVHEVAQIDPARQRQELEPVQAEPAGTGTILALEGPKPSAVASSTAAIVAGLVARSVAAPPVSVEAPPVLPPLSEARVDFIDPMAPAVSGVSVSSEPIAVRQADGDWQWVWPDQDATRVIEIVEADDIEVRLPRAGLVFYVGSEVVGNQRRPLPLGSRLDGVTGAFLWRRVHGLPGRIDLEFVGADGVTVRMKLVVGATSAAATTQNAAASTPPEWHP